MRNVRIIAGLLAGSVAVSILMTFLGFWLVSKLNPPQSGNFNLFGNQPIFATLIVSTIYGGMIGFVIGLFSGTFFSIFNPKGSITIWSVVGFSVAVGLVEALAYYLSVASTTSQDRGSVLAYLFVSGFLTALLPFIVIRRILPNTDSLRIIG